jgi:hypothetical protein
VLSSLTEVVALLHICLLSLPGLNTVVYVLDIKTAYLRDRKKTLVLLDQKAFEQIRSEANEREELKLSISSI